MIYSIKECFNIKDTITRLGLSQNSKLTYFSIYDSTIVEILKKQGSLIPSETTHFCTGVLDKTKIHGNGLYAGASSSGSVIGLELGLADVAISTDTGGSTIVPGARMNYYAYKPTYGRISRYGLVPLCSKLDTVGVISKSFEGIKQTFKLLDFLDPKDLTSTPLIDRGLKEGLVLKISRNLFSEKDASRLKELFPEAVFCDLDLNQREIMGAYWYELCPDFYSNMARFNGVHFKIPDAELIPHYKKDIISKLRSLELTKDVKSRIILGAFLLKNYDYNVILKFKTKYHSRLSNDLWITPIAKGLYSNELTQTPICALMNLLKRPAITLPLNLENGVLLSGPANSDLNLFKLVENLKLF